MKAKRLGLLLIVMAAAARLPAAHFGDLGPYFSFSYGDGGGIPAGATNVTGQTTSPDGQGVKLFGSVGPIAGADFHTGFVLDWSGSFQGPINPGDYFTADLSFDPEVTGGSLAWSFYANLWSNEGFEQARILTDEMSLSGSGPVPGIHLASSSFAQSGDTGIFEGYLHIDWSGYGPDDTFSLTIPQNSIDLTYVSVPEPGAAALVGLGLILGLLRPARRVARELNQPAAPGHQRAARR